jgi:hypothetical protein
VRLRDVEPTDVGLYVRLRCDPVMVAELGGPLPKGGIEAKVARDVASVADPGVTNGPSNGISRALGVTPRRPADWMSGWPAARPRSGPTWLTASPWP